MNFFKFWIRKIALLRFSQKHLCEISLKCEILWGPVDHIKQKKGNKKQFAKNAVVWFRVSHIYSRRSLSIAASYDSQIHLGASQIPLHHEQITSFKLSIGWDSHAFSQFMFAFVSLLLLSCLLVCNVFAFYLRFCCEDVCLHCVEGCHTNYIHHEFTWGGVQCYFSECDVCFEVDLHGFPCVGSTSSQANWHENISCFNGGPMSILIAQKAYVPQNLKLTTHRNMSSFDGHLTCISMPKQREPRNMSSFEIYVSTPCIHLRYSPMQSPSMPNETLIMF